MNQVQRNDERRQNSNKRKETEREKHFKRLVKRWKSLPNKQAHQRNIKKGDRVEIITGISGLLHRKRQTGIVTKRNGAYLYVRPHWCKWETECYDVELVKY